MERASAVWASEAQSIAKLGRTIDGRALSAAATLIGSARRTVLTGAGTSGQAAKKIAHTLSCIEVPSLYVNPADAMHGGMGVVQEGDVAVLISKGGDTREIVDLIPALRHKRIPIVGVTERADSGVGRAARVLLCVSVEREPDRLNMLATASTMAVIAVFDALAVVLMEERGFSPEQFLAIHPGGAVGDRLRERKESTI